MSTHLSHPLLETGFELRKRMHGDHTQINVSRHSHKRQQDTVAALRGLSIMQIPPFLSYLERLP